MHIKKALVTMAAAAALICTAMPATALAAEGTTETSTEFSYTKQNDPTYTVSIPSSLTLSEEGTPLDITASDVAYLNGKHVSVTIAGTNYFRNQLVLTGTVSKNSYSSVLRYQLIGADGTTIETTGTDTASGRELASFTEDGTVTYTVKPTANGLEHIESGVTYTGTMTFGIGLAE